MNKVYKSVWNESIGTWVAVSETAAARGKRNGRLAKAALASAVTLGAAGSAFANTPGSANSDVSGVVDTGHFDSSVDGTVTSDADVQTVDATGLTMGTSYKAVRGLLTAKNDIAGTFNQKYLSAVDADTSPTGAQATGTGSIAIGGNAIADATDGPDAAIAIGSNAMAKTRAVAVGPNATATAFNSVALGTFSVADRATTVSVGSATIKRQIVNVAAGTQANDAVNVSQLTPLVGALGGTAAFNADGSVTGPTYSIKGTTYTNVGDALTALSDSSGNSGKYFHVNSSGVDSIATGTNATAIGTQSVASGGNSTAIGAKAITSGIEAVAIGSDVQSTASDSISMGSQIVNAGKSSIAIGSNALSIDSASNTSVLLAPDTGEVVNSSHSFSFNPYGGTGTSNSNDAINLSGTVTNAAGAVAVGSKSSVTAANAVALGASATATFANSVAVGAGSATDRANSVSVGTTTNLRQIANVGAGTQANDAVNVTQLQNVTTLLGGGAKVNANGTVQAPAYTVAGTQSATVGDAISKIDSELANKVAYDTTDKSHVTLGGVGTTKPVTISNVAAGALTSNSTDAVNGSQLNSTNQNVSTLQTFATNINNGGGIKYFHSNSSLADSSATGADAVAIGGAAVASADNSVAIGAGSTAIRANTVSVGAAGKERQITNVAAGTQSTDAVNLAQLTAVSQDVSKLDGFAVKYDATDKLQVTLGGAGAAVPTKLTNLKIGDLDSTSTDAINGSQLYSTNKRVGSLETFEGNINNGGGIKYFHTNSKLADSSATGADSVAVGGAAVASGANSVALGSNSVADRDNSVSVGAAGKERQVTNVAAGTASTDAVNVGQLTTVSNNLGTLDSFAVKYDANTDGTPNYEQITLGGAAAKQPTLLTNLANGKLADDSTDAVNGSQLYATNKNVAALQDFTNNVNNGGGIKYFHTNSTLADSSATGADSVAIGGAAVSSGKNSVALGSNSVADRDNSVSVGATGSERQVTNVAAGTAATDAVNVGQLNAVSSSVSSLSAAAIKYDTNADGTPDYANATLGNGNATGTALHNVAAGTSAMDAVNLGQLSDMMGQVTNLANGAYNPLFTADGDRNSEVATSSGTHSVASGANAVASGVNAVASGATSVASGANAVALGANTSATAKNAVAVGSNASATASNAVALGAGSVADRANTVSVGTTSAGGQRQVTNVAAGTEGTDAVNVNQMQQSVNTGVKSAKGYTDALRSDMNSGLSIANNHINSVGAMSSAMAMMAGSAAAVADKDNRFAAGTGVYRDKAAIAVGFQKRFGTNMVITIGGSTTGEETTGGAGFAFGF